MVIAAPPSVNHQAPLVIVVTALHRLAGRVMLISEPPSPLDHLVVRCRLLSAVETPSLSVPSPNRRLIITSHASCEQGPAHLPSALRGRGQGQVTFSTRLTL